MSVAATRDLQNYITVQGYASINHAGSKTFSINKLEDEEIKKLLLDKIEF